MSTNLLTVITCSAATSAVVGGAIVAGFVNLQDTTPGTAQTGHINVTGTAIAGKVRVGTTLAGGSLVRVEDTSGTGGIYSKSTGNGVYSESTGLSGSLLGGEFISRSTTGKGIISSATAPSGNTRGGLFDSKSPTGIGVVGTSSALTGTGIGVLGSATAASANAIVANNPNAGQRAELAGPNGTLLTKGQLPRHEYTAGNARSMVPIAYGYVSTEGTIFSGSGNFTLTPVSTGVVEVDVTGIVIDFRSASIQATAVEAGGDQFATSTSPATGDFRINVFDISTNALVTSAVTFVVYLPAGFVSPPAALAKPDMGGARDTEEWQRRNPAAFRRWLRAYQDWEREATAVKEAQVSTGDARPQ